MLPQTKRLLIASAGLLLAGTVMAGQGRYMDQESFLDHVFADAEPRQDALWVSPKLRESIEQILGRRFPMLRIRYWHSGATTAWILDEIGKVEPITIGVSIDNAAVGLVRVLEFRESRGWEVRYPFFTDQFAGAALARNRAIDRHVDGISGATLSVAAVSRAVQLALMLDEQVAVSEQDAESETAARTH